MPSATHRRLFMGPPWTPYGLPNTAARYSLDGAASDATYLIDGSNRLMLVADRSGQSATNGLVNNGTASNTVTAATKSVTGNQTFSWNGTLSTFTPASNLTLCSKTSGLNGFSFLLLTTGVLRLTIGDGAALTNYDSTTGMSAGAFTNRTLTATYTDGGSGNVVFAVDGVQLGTTVATTKTLTNAATNFVVTLDNVLGVVFSVSVGSVYSCNPASAAKLASSFSSGGDTYTVNTSGDTGARICGARDLYQGTQAKQAIFTASSSGNYATFDGVNDYMKAAPFSLSQPESAYFVGSQVTWTGGKTFFDGNALNSGHLQQDTSSPRIRAYAGTSLAFISPALATRVALITIFNGASSVIAYNTNTAVTGAVGAANLGGFTIGALADASSPINATFSEALIRSNADDTPTQLRIAGYMIRKWSIVP